MCWQIHSKPNPERHGCARPRAMEGPWTAVANCQVITVSVQTIRLLLGYAILQPFRCWELKSNLAGVVQPGCHEIGGRVFI